jgi:hypothetical protein
MNAAELLADHKGDYAAAAQTLDTALAKDTRSSPTERLQALVMRIGYAITLDDRATAKKLLDTMRGIELTPDEREQLAETLQTADDLEQQLNSPTLQQPTNPL